MQVLVKNKYAQELEIENIHETFWDSNSYYMDENFTMSSIFELSDPLGFSPFYFLDPRVSFLISQMNWGGDLIIRGVGPIGTVAALGKVDRGMHFEDQTKVNNTINEYLPKSNVETLLSYDQVVVFGEQKIDEVLWKNLRPGGFYLLGSITGKINPLVDQYEPFGKMWPLGMPTETGWKFNDSKSGLVEFEFTKLKKLA
jgi:hypothetical protein